MKTSNIILLAIFASVLIWITAGFITVKSKIKNFVNEHPEVIEKKDTEVKRETIKLDEFHTIIVNGKGNLYVEQSDENSFSQIVDDENIIELRNDTLFINASGEKCNLYVNSIDNILTKEKVRVELSDLKIDSLTIFTNEASKLKLKGLNSSVLLIQSFDKSKVKLKNVNRNKGMRAQFFLKDFSQLEIDDTEGISLSVQKDSDAKYEDD